MNNEYDVEEQAAWLDSIEVGKFDANSIMLAAKIGREVRRRSGRIISLRDKNVVPELGRAVIEIDERDLNLMFRSLLERVVIKESAAQISDEVVAKSKRGLGLRSLFRS